MLDYVKHCITLYIQSQHKNINTSEVFGVKCVSAVDAVVFARR